MTEKQNSQQKQKIDSMETLLRLHAKERTPWDDVLALIQRDYTDVDVVCLIDRIHPTAFNLRIIYEGLVTDRL